MSGQYNILTWDMAAEIYTEQEGMENPCFGVDISGLLNALRELRQFGYTCHRTRNADGAYDSDPSVLVERIDDPMVDKIMESK